MLDVFIHEIIILIFKIDNLYMHIYTFSLHESLTILLQIERLKYTYLAHDHMLLIFKVNHESLIMPLSFQL